MYIIVSYLSFPSFEPFLFFLAAAYTCTPVTMRALAWVRKHYLEITWKLLGKHYLESTTWSFSCFKFLYNHPENMPDLTIKSMKSLFSLFSSCTFRIFISHTYNGLLPLLETAFWMPRQNIRSYLFITPFYPPQIVLLSVGGMQSLPIKQNPPRKISRDPTQPTMFFFFPSKVFYEKKKN